MPKLDAYSLKILAIVGMFTNHFVIALREVLSLPVMIPLYMLGGLTFPIMAFFVVEGYRHTSNIKRYIARLAIFGILAQPGYIFALRLGQLNIMFTIILSILILMIYDRLKSRVLFYIILVPTLFVVSMFFDWPLIGPLVVFLYHAIKTEGRRRIVSGIVAGAFMTLMTLPLVIGPDVLQNQVLIDATGGMDMAIAVSTFGIGCFAAAFLIRGYNGERGRRMKWFFYAFYPIHLTVLAVIALALGLVSFDTISDQLASSAGL